MRRFGDRRDAVKVRDMDGLHKIMVCFKPLRADSDVYIDEEIDVTALMAWLRDKKAADPELTFFHVICDALAMMLYNRPLLNRYVLSRRWYDRTEVSIGFVAKVALDDESKENVSLIKFDPTDTLGDVKDKIAAKVRDVRSDTNYSTGGVIDFLGHLPQALVNPIVWALKQADVHDLLPAAMISDDIYHSTLIVSNLGSIQCESIYHNLTDFGTSSMLVAIGQIHKASVVNENGEAEIRDMCRFGMTCDERIADGFYFAKSINMLKWVLAHPEVLEQPIGQPVGFDAPR